MDSIDEQPEKEKNKEERKMENEEMEKEENKQGEIDKDPNRVESYSWLFEESSKELSKQGRGKSLTSQNEHNQDVMEMESLDESKIEDLDQNSEDSRRTARVGVQGEELKVEDFS